MTIIGISDSAVLSTATPGAIYTTQHNQFSRYILLRYHTFSLSAPPYLHSHSSNMPSSALSPAATDILNTSICSFPDQHLLNSESCNLPPLKFPSCPALSPYQLHCVLPPVSPERHSVLHPSSPNQKAPLLPNFSPLQRDLSPKANGAMQYGNFTTPSTPSSASSLQSLAPASVNEAHEIDVCKRTVAMHEQKVSPVKRSIRTPRGIREVYICPFPRCDRISSEHSNMKAHLRLHTGERPYVCRVASCRKSFRWKSSLTYHERALHSNSRPYQCSGCRKSFVERRKLRLHLQLCPAIRAINSGILPTYKQL